MKQLKIYVALTLCGFSVLTNAKNNPVDTGDLRQYINKPYGFSLSYPTIYAAGTKFSTAYLLANNWSNLSPEKSNNTLQDSVWQVELQNDDLTSDNAKYYYQTYVRVGVSGDAEDVAFCEKNTNDGATASISKTMLIGGQPFIASTFYEANVSQFKSGVSYRRLHDGKCYSIEYVETGSNSSSIPRYAELSSKNQAIAKKIVNSFSFVDASSQLTQETPSLTLTTNGIGGINSKTGYALKEIQTLFPTYDVKAVTATTEGMPYEVIAVSNDKEKLFTIFHKFDVPKSKKILCIATRSNSIVNDEEVKIGDTYKSIYKGSAKCLPGTEAMSGSVICRAPGVDNIYYTFKGEGGGTDGTVPPKAVLRTFQVTEIIWLANPDYADGLTQYCHA